MLSIFKAFTPDGTRDLLRQRFKQFSLQQKATPTAVQAEAIAELVASHFAINKIPMDRTMAMSLEVAPFMCMSLDQCHLFLVEYLMYRMPNELARRSVNLPQLQDAISEAIVSPSQQHSAGIAQAYELLSDKNLFLVYGEGIPWIEWLSQPAIDKLIALQSGAPCTNV